MKCPSTPARESERLEILEEYGLSSARQLSSLDSVVRQSEVMVVPDATADDRFHDNPLVTGVAGLRFYAGAPLLSPEGFALGALCVIDSSPHRNFSREDRDRLRDLADMAAYRLEIHRGEVRKLKK